MKASNTESGERVRVTRSLSHTHPPPHTQRHSDRSYIYLEAEKSSVILHRDLQTFHAEEEAMDAQHVGKVDSFHCEAHVQAHTTIGSQESPIHYNYSSHTHTHTQ